MSLTNYFSRSGVDIDKDERSRACMLKPVVAEYKTIHLENGKNIVGRNRESGIRDRNCSKNQIELNVNMQEACIKLKVIGVNPASVNGVMAAQNTECVLKHGDIIEVLYGRHTFEVIFKPPPSQQKMNDNSSKTNENAQINDKLSWQVVENGELVIFTSAGVQASEKIAGYDMDGTIIRTKSLNVFPKNCDDWDIIHANVPKKLKSLYEDGFKITWFTNQGGIGKGKTKLEDFKKKIMNIRERLGIPIQVFISIKDGYFRKPLPGMWEYLIKHENDNIKPKLEKSFYVGDAAGRAMSGIGVKQRKDHSLVDRLFAFNIGLTFYTPENHFLGLKTEPYNGPEFEPVSVNTTISLLEPNTAKLTLDEKEMIIMVGLPGSGKSNFSNQHLKPMGYTVANADNLGNIKACIKVCEQALIAEKSVVIDNTNVDTETRKKYIDLAKHFKIPCRCFVMNLTLAHIKHNLKFRELTDAKHSKINEMVLNMMKKKYQAPVLNEGFKEIVKVNLQPNFQNEEEERLYKLYLIEK